MTRRTSAATYRQIEAEGLLSRQRWQVYSLLYDKGPATARELAEALRAATPSIRDARCVVTRRLPELRDMGVVVELPTRECRVSGREAIVWDVTDALPTPLPDKPKLSKADKHAALVALRRYWTSVLLTTDERKAIERLGKWLRHSVEA